MGKARATALYVGRNAGFEWAGLVRMGAPYGAKRIAAWVVLPDHIHCTWKLPPEDDNYALRWSLLKRHFTRTLCKSSVVPRGNRKGERRAWQRRFWEHAIRDERDLENHFKYIRGNPVRHGLVQNIEDWPHSSFYERNRQNVGPYSTLFDLAER